MGNASERLDSNARRLQRERLLEIMHGRFGSEADRKHTPPNYSLEMAKRFVEEASETDLKEWSFRPSVIKPCLVFQRTRARGGRSYEDVLILLEETKIHCMISSVSDGVLRVWEVDLSVKEPHEALSDRSEIDSGAKNEADQETDEKA